jgi:integrase
MLTDVDCRKAICPHGLKRKRYTDAAGLYLEVSDRGSKRWFWKFYPEGKESRLALGSYPDVTLKAARSARDAARLVRQSGANPVQRRKAERAAATISSATTFEAIARELYGVLRPSWSEAHATQWLRCCEKDLFPRLGPMPMDDISAPLLLDTLKRVQSRGAIRMAHDLLQYAGQIFRYAARTGRCAHPTRAADLRGALVPFVERNMGAVLEPEAVGQLLRAIDSYAGQPLTRAALRLAALLFQRPGNIRAMEWAHMDLQDGLWTIPSSAMKRTVAGKANGRPHLVPLAPQAIAILTDEVLPLTGGKRFVFPSLLTGERCMSENTMRGALRRLGYANEEMTAHGFRAVARTLLVERLDVDPAIVEAQLAHGKSGPLGEAYDRAKYMQQRRAVMVQWADYLDRLRKGAHVVPFNARSAS